MPTYTDWCLRYTAKERRAIVKRQLAKRAAKWQKIKDDFARKRSSQAGTP